MRAQALFGSEWCCVNINRMICIVTYVEMSVTPKVVSDLCCQLAYDSWYKKILAFLGVQ